MPSPPELNPAETALFLDLDGTLMEIEAHPEWVRMPQDLRATLHAALQRFSGALAIVTGRSLDSLDRVIDPLMLPAAAEHGVQFRLTQASDSTRKCRASHPMSGNSSDVLPKPIPVYC